ncbi:hypothetical protein [Nonomuraea basaltis]|nr:hypothetical protein [Nonomuraea basaltis]
MRLPPGLTGAEAGLLSTVRGSVPAGQAQADVLNPLLDPVTVPAVPVS